MEAQMQETKKPSSVTPNIGSSHMAPWQKIILFSVIEIGIIAGSIMGGIVYEKQMALNRQQSDRADTANLLKSRIIPSESPASLLPVTSVTVSPIPTISLVSVCSTLPISLFPTPKADEKQVCQVIELRARDLLQATYNLHHLLREVQNGQIQQTGLNKVNDLNNNLWDLWLHIAGYGLGTDPLLGRIMVSGSGSSDGRSAPNYGLSGEYLSIGMPRLYNRFIENSTLDLSGIQQKEKAFASLVQAYANPAEYPFKDFYDRAYFSYRGGKLLDTPQFQQDLKAIDVWLSGIESVLLQIPTFLKS